jgi:hypothetical protein
MPPGTMASGSDRSPRGRGRRCRRPPPVEVGDVGHDVADLAELELHRQPVYRRSRADGDGVNRTREGRLTPPNVSGTVRQSPRGGAARSSLGSWQRSLDKSAATKQYEGLAISR